MDEMKKRTFTVTKRTLERLELIHECYKINKATFVRMAVHHGILKLVNGYRPLRSVYRSEKVKLDISLPEKTWEAFNRCMNKISKEVDKYLEISKKLEIEKTSEEKKKRVLYLENKMTHSEMIETLLRIEMDKYWMLIKDVEDKQKDYDKWLYEKHEPVSATINLTYPLYSKLCQEKKKTGLKETQLNKYHFTSALVDEYLYKEFDTIFTDADLLIHIEALGLPQVKAMQLIKNLVASGKMIYRTDIGKGNE